MNEKSHSTIFKGVMKNSNSCYAYIPEKEREKKKNVAIRGKGFYVLISILYKVRLESLYK